MYHAIPVPLTGERTANRRTANRRVVNNMPEDKKLWTANMELRPVAAPLIAENHKHLMGLTIEYLFFSGDKKSGGRLVLGKAKRAGDELCELAGHHIDFVITVSSDWWKTASDSERTALMDHELSHCSMDIETGQPMIVGHDVEEFSSVIRRNGIWKDELRKAAEAMGQVQLDFDGGQASHGEAGAE